MRIIPSADVGIAGERCYLCTNSKDLVETGGMIEGEGVLALCRSCVEEAAALYGGIPPEQAAQLKQAAETANKRAAAMFDAVRVAEAAALADHDKAAGYGALLGFLDAPDAL